MATIDKITSYILLSLGMLFFPLALYLKHMQEGLAHIVMLLGIIFIFIANAVAYNGKVGKLKKSDKNAIGMTTVGLILIVWLYMVDYNIDLGKQEAVIAALKGSEYDGYIQSCSSIFIPIILSGIIVIMSSIQLTYF